MKTELNPIEYTYKNYNYVLLNNRHNEGIQGYVEIKKGHPLFRLKYTDESPLPKNKVLFDSEFSKNPDELIENYGAFAVLMSVFDNKDLSNVIAYNFRVHGGITFSGPSYWDKKKYSIDDFKEKEEIKKIVKLSKLRSYAGNDLYSYYKEQLEFSQKIDDENKKLFYRNQLESLQKRYFKISQAEENYKPTLTLKSGITYKDYLYNVKEEVLYCYDDNWYYGWDCNHFGDTKEEFDEERGHQECQKLIDQLTAWTELYYNV